MTGDYEVGYGKPPSQTRFAKGRSGNPKGRPKGTKNLKTDLLEELGEQVLLREGAAEKRLSKQRALVKSLTTKAIKGDTRAANLVLNMVLRLIETEETQVDDLPVTAEERAILATFEQRLLSKARQESRTRSDGAGEAIEPDPDPAQLEEESDPP